MKGIVAGLLAAWAISAGGCASIDGYPKQAVDTTADSTALKPQYDAAAVTAYLGKAGETERRAQRDRIVYGRMLAYDAAFAQFQRDLTGQGNLLNIGGSAGNTILNTGATLAKSARTKTRLGAAGLALSAIRTDASKQLFYERTLPAILSQMEADRLQLRLPIEEGLTRTDGEYSLMKALVDLKGYENAGSISAAVSAISRSAENQKAETAEEIAVIRKASYLCDKNCERLVAWAYPNGDRKKAPDPGKVAQIQAELTKLNITDPWIFVVTTNEQPSYAAARAKLTANPALSIP